MNLFVFQNEMLNQNRALSKEILTLFGRGDLKLGRSKAGRDESFCCPCVLSLGKICSFVMWDELHAISMAWSAVDTTCTEQVPTSVAAPPGTASTAGGCR